jgi:hypothetical protein
MQGAKWFPQDLIVAPPTAGEYIFVDGNVSTGGSGTTWADAYSTIEDATDSASRGDVIMVAPKATNGYYEENVRIPKGDDNTSDEYGLCGLHLMGVTNAIKNVRIKCVTGSSSLHAYSNVNSVSVTGTCLFVSCSGIEVSNLAFHAESAFNGVYWGDGYRPFAYTGQTDAQNGSIHDCTFMFGYDGINYDGSSNDQFCYNNRFYKQGDQAALINPGGLQQTSRIRFFNNFVMGPEDYGVYVYSHAQNKNHTIGPNNVFQDQASGTEMTNPVYLANGTPTNAVIGNYFACENDNAAGTNDQSCGNYDGTTGATVVHVRES